ncbi:MAG: YncE family protein [Gemmatimonadetes bacterium]|nr:YncE family protein [Gemmatimonadota bacterium]
MRHLAVLVILTGVMSGAVAEAQQPQQAQPLQAMSAGPTPSTALLVGEKSGGRLAIIDPSTLEVVARIQAGVNLHEVATDGRYAYVGSNWPGITVLNLREQRFERAIDPGVLGPFHGLWVANGKLYVGHERSNIVTRYDPETQAFDMAVGVPGGPHLLQVTPDERVMYMTSSASRQAIIAEASTAARGVWRFTTFRGDTRMEGFDVSPDGKEFWALNMNQKSISVIDLEARQLVATLAFQGRLNNRIQFTNDGKYVLMNELNGNELLVWDVATRAIVKRIDVGGGGEGIIMDPQRPRAYYAVSRANKLAVIDTNTMTVIKEIPDLINPDGMAWYEAR